MPQLEESQNKENGGDGDEEMGEPEEGPRLLGLKQAE